MQENENEWDKNEWNKFEWDKMKIRELKHLIIFVIFQNSKFENVNHFRKPDAEDATP